MTVEELINRLKQFPKNARVVIDDGGGEVAVDVVTNFYGPYDTDVTIIAGHEVMK